MTNDSEEGKPQGSAVERHAQTIIAAVLLALLLWTGNTMLDIRTDVTTMKVQIATLEGALRSAGDDRFRGTDWRREKEIIDQRFSRIERDIELWHQESQRPPRRP